MKGSPTRVKEALKTMKFTLTITDYDRSVTYHKTAASRTEAEKIKNSLNASEVAAITAEPEFPGETEITYAIYGSFTLNNGHSNEWRFGSASTLEEATKRAEAGVKAGDFEAYRIIACNA